jgi:hypothetical protein
MRRCSSATTTPATSRRSLRIGSWSAIAAADRCPGSRRCRGSSARTTSGTATSTGAPNSSNATEPRSAQAPARGLNRPRPPGLSRRCTSPTSPVTWRSGAQPTRSPTPTCARPARPRRASRTATSNTGWTAASTTPRRWPRRPTPGSPNSANRSIPASPPTRTGQPWPSSSTSPTARACAPPTCTTSPPPDRDKHHAGDSDIDRQEGCAAHAHRPASVRAATSALAGAAARLRAHLRIAAATRPPPLTPGRGAARRRLRGSTVPEFRQSRFGRAPRSRRPAGMDRYTPRAPSADEIQPRLP